MGEGEFTTIRPKEPGQGGEFRGALAPGPSGSGAPSTAFPDLRVGVLQELPERGWDSHPVLAPDPYESGIYRPFNSGQILALLLGIPLGVWAIDSRRLRRPSTKPPRAPIRNIPMTNQTMSEGGLGLT